MSIVWFNGAIVESTISIDPTDRGLTLGDGIFETILVQGSHAVWLEEHLSRMKSAAEEVGIVFDELKLRDGISTVLKMNPFSKSILRINLSRGVVQQRTLAGFGSVASLLISLSEFSGTSTNAISLATSKIRRNETSPTSRLKTLSYIDNIMAAREIATRADDALMLNSAGHVACTSIGNIFLLKGDQMITPRSDQGILPGITRSKLLTLAHEAIVTVDDLLEADAVFRTNSLRLVTPVSKVDDKSLKQGSLDDIQKFIIERISS